ncbi:hypothetical protein [Fibrella aestuarina]|uniref:hypothetical protein n=1 Tax=Fibrella aestuarina TaxID=651143 RepID=UPI00059CD3A4|nr:hypothetical protein [Fibrella aestuarina]
MKRSEKTALLAKLLQGGIDQGTVKRLFKPDLKPLIVIYEANGNFPQPTDKVVVKGLCGEAITPYSELTAYAQHVGGCVKVMLPDNGR